jgi:DNA-binding PadR family transcriptional regulator
VKEAWRFSVPGWQGYGFDAKRRMRFFGLGEVRLAVLSLIADGPKHGYQLMKELASRLGSLYRASSGTVYPVLAQLLKEGLIQFQLEEGRKMYRLTEAGKKVLSAEAPAVAEIWSRAEEVEDLGQQVGPHSMVIASPLSELSATALRASNWSAGDPDREDQIRGILRQAAAELNQLMTPDQKHAQKHARKHSRSNQ